MADIRTRADFERVTRPVMPPIEVTPEMIEAGTDALCAVCDELSSKTETTLEWIVSSVYAAMVEARK